jgi:TIR domain
VLFMSYADEDWAAAREVGAKLRTIGIDVYDWKSRRGGPFVREIQQAISQADGFVALMSPHYLSSKWCRDEWELALQREHDLQADEPERVFVCVVQVAATPHDEAGFLRTRDWLAMTGQEGVDGVIATLAERLVPRTGPGSEQPAASRDDGAAAQSSSLFRNRREELDSVLRGLTNVAGPHFWLVVAPPQLGKTWFTDQLRAEITGGQETVSRWATKLVDMRVQPAALRGDARSLLAQLFEPLVNSERATPRNIARAISRSNKSFLCLLDSAELLTQEAVRTLRAELGATYQHVQDAHNRDIRLALVVATRHDQGWQGLTSDPRLTALPLTEFKFEVVLEALRDLATRMGRTLGPPELRVDARRIHELSEGMPALLVPCLNWIQDDEWVQPSLLATDELFVEIAHHYISRRLLAEDILYPDDDGGQTSSALGAPGAPLSLLEETFRLLAPYRLFTQSHLRHHADSDPAFAAAIAALNWSIEDVWAAVSNSALLRRPQPEPWQEINPAIRRLLYRYFYRSSEAQAHAHHEARKFVEVWADRQKGKEQVVGLVESLWHEACEARLTDPAQSADRLIDSARSLSAELKRSEAYTVPELRDFAADRMSGDEEFRNALVDVGLFGRLVSTVKSPGPGGKT